MVEQIESQAAQHILRLRAQALAALEHEAAGQHGEEQVCFRVGEQAYAIPARAVREIQPLRRYTTLPQTPAHIVGLVNVRGRIMAALDVRPLLEGAAAPPQPDALLILISAHGVEVGLLADSVSAIRPGDAELVPTLSATSGRAVSWLRGVDANLHLVIDPAGLLADPRVNASPEGA